MPGRCPGTLFFFWAGGTWWRDSPLGCAGTVGRGWSARGPVVLLDWVGRSWIVAALHCRKDRFVECGVGCAGTARSTAGAGFPGAGHARDGGVGAVVGGRQEKRTLERPGRRSHAGAWERSARIGTISVGGRSTSKMVRTAQPTLGRAWGAGGSGVGAGRGGVLGKQERPGSGGCRAGWDAAVRRGDQAWVLRRRPMAARPARPVPKSSMVAGSGTGFTSRPAKAKSLLLS